MKTVEKIAKKLFTYTKSVRKTKLARARHFAGKTGVAFLPNPTESGSYSEVVEYIFKSPEVCKEFDCLVNLNDVDSVNPDTLTSKLKDAAILKPDSLKLKSLHDMGSKILYPNPETENMTIYPDLLAKKEEGVSVGIPAETFCEIANKIFLNDNGMVFRASLDGIRLDFLKDKIQFTCTNGIIYKHISTECEFPVHLVGKTFLIRSGTAKMIFEIYKATKDEMISIWKDEKYTVVRYGHPDTGMVRSVTETPPDINYNVIMSKPRSYEWVVNLAPKTVSEIIRWLNKLTQNETVVKYNLKGEVISSEVVPRASRDYKVALVLTEKEGLRLVNLSKVTESQLVDKDNLYYDMTSYNTRLYGKAVTLERHQEALTDNSFTLSKATMSLCNLLHLEKNKGPSALKFEENGSWTHGLVAAFSTEVLLKCLMSLPYNQEMDISNCFNKGENTGPVFISSNHSVSITMPIRTKFELGKWSHIKS